MRVAYADPPYPGYARYYADQPDYAGEVDHALLVHELNTYDAWALHTTSSALRDLLPLCPSETRVLAWVKGWASWKSGISPAFAWEPVLIYGQRPVGDESKVRDWLACHPVTGAEFIGAKPEPVVRWVFDALGLEHDDELDDLYPGSGAVGRTWQSYRAQTRLDHFGLVDQMELAE